MITDAELEARIELGVAWLDGNQPEWLGRIDLGRLDLGIGCDCILGQTYLGDLTAQDPFISALNAWGEGGLEWARQRGFYAMIEDAGREDDTDPVYDRLTLLWRERIEKLRADLP